MLKEAVRTCGETWRGAQVRPKVHFSSPRTDWGYRHGSEEKARRPDWSAHAEFVDPFAFIDAWRAIADLAPGVVLEAKAKDVAVLQSRDDLARYAPDLHALFAGREEDSLPACG